MDGSSFLAAFAGSSGDGAGGSQGLKAKTASSSSEEVIHFNGILDSFPVKGKQVSTEHVFQSFP